MVQLAMSQRWHNAGMQLLGREEALGEGTHFQLLLLFNTVKRAPAASAAVKRGLLLC